ncbi:MAG: ABC transporter permease subunit [Chloroflexi bacterium]|nr:ABC transporter permease subunit [Chloroflexota bacterium]
MIWTAIVMKDLASRLQGRLSYVILTLMVVAFTGLVLGSFWVVIVSVPTIVPVIGSSSTSGSAMTLTGLIGAYRGVFLFFAMAFCLLAAIGVIAPAVAASSVSGEREESTFDLLLSTGLAPFSIVFGKLAASATFVLLVALTAVPGFAMAWMFGGVGPIDLVLTVVLLLATIGLFSAIGVFCSALGRTSAVAALYAYGIVFVLGMGTLAIYVLGAAAQMEGTVRPLLALNPWITLFSLPEGISNQVAQILPFTYRPLIDGTAQQELFGIGGLRYPRWALTLVLYLLLTAVFLGLSSVAIDPCHRLKEHRWARALLSQGAE